MKTTLDLPDDLMREVKIRAVMENRRLKDEIADLLRRGLAVTEPQRRRVSRRVRLPLVECSHRADPGQEVTPERTAAILLGEESGGSR